MPRDIRILCRDWAVLDKHIVMPARKIVCTFIHFSSYFDTAKTISVSEKPDLSSSPSLRSLRIPPAGIFRCREKERHVAQ